MAGRSQIPPSLLLSNSFCLELSVTKFLVRNFPKKLFFSNEIPSDPLKLRIFLRNIPFGMKLSLDVSHCSAPRCVFFAVVETEERDTSQ